MIVYDTGVLIEERFQPDEADRIGVTALSLAELEFGVSVAAARGAADEVRRRATRLGIVRSRFGAGLPFDGAASLAYGSVTAAVLHAGRNPRARTVDLLIAAIAISRGAALLTTQPQEFAGLGDLLEVRATSPG